MRVRIAVALAAELVVCGLTGCRKPAVAPPPAPPRTLQQRVTETPLGKLAPEDPRNSRPMEKLSPDGLHVAWIATDGRSSRIAVDGELGPVFDEIGAIPNRSADIGWTVCAEWSEDSNHIAYLGRKGKAWHVVIDGDLGRGFGHVRVDEGHTFSPDGLRHAYVARAQGKEMMVVDGEVGPPCDYVYPAVFSPDSRRVAYVAHSATEGERVIVDGDVMDSAERIDTATLTFSPDGRRFAYAVSKPEAILVVDGERRGGVSATGIVFSPDSRRVAYVDHAPPGLSGKCQVVCDGIAGPVYECVGRVGFTPDSQQVCYAASKGAGKGQVVVVGATESRTYEGVAPTPFTDPMHGTPLRPAPVFSADGKHSAYGARRDNRGRVVLDGREGPEYEYVGDIVFSPDGTRLAHWVQFDDGKWAVVVNDEPGPRWDESEGAPPVFSPDSKRVAYQTRDRRGGAPVRRVVVDGEAAPVHTYVSQPAFSPDSRHVAYRATEGDWEHWREMEDWIVLDGEDGPRYEDVLEHRGPTFLPDGSIEYIAIRDDTVYRVRHVPPEQRAAGAR